MHNERIIGIIAGVVFGIVLFIVIVDLLRKIVIVSKGTCVVIERFGKFNTVLYEGLHFLMPFADYPRAVTWRETEVHTDANHRQHVQMFQSTITRIDLREQMFDFMSQAIITRDNVELTVHPMLLYQLVDPIKVAYQTFDLPTAVSNLVRTSLRSIIGDMGLDDTLASREEINSAMSQKISRICLDWGMKVTQVEVLEIYPTPSIQQAMHKQLSAERVRRAAIVTAEGYREQVRTEAEGSSQAAIAISNGEAAVQRLRAEGAAKSKEVLADAEARSVETLAQVLKMFGVEPTQYLIGVRYLETFLAVAGGAHERSIVFPYEASIFGMVKDFST
mmetsp:Transcript_11346/g.33644  ORF Transcript_11346/g.33644 Transcript_11346/m.33644 type:complete len:333 (+) Transcript_11346:99-1097(+)